MRLLVLAGLLPASFAAAVPWRQENAVETRLHQLELKSETPAIERREPLWGLSGRARWQQDAAAAPWSHELGFDYGRSLQSTRHYQVLRGRSSFGMDSPQARTQLSLDLLQSRGSDPVNRPIEDLVAENNEPFTSAQLSLSHQKELDARHSLRAEAGVSENHQSRVAILTEDLQLAWIYRLQRTWTSSWRLRITQQQQEAVAENQQRELANDHLFILSPLLRAELGVGYSVRYQAAETTQGMIYLAALSYSSQTTTEADDDEKTKAPRTGESSQLRGTSQLRGGWSRSRDQRRVGDPIFIADQTFFQAHLGLSPAHSLQADARQTDAKDSPSGAGLGPYRELSTSVGYRFRHELGTAQSGSWGLEAAQQITRDGPLRFRRTLYTMLYGLTF